MPRSGQGNDAGPTPGNGPTAANSSPPGSPPAPPLVPDHELLKLIGRGSYGEVWLARNVMGTPRAVKFVSRASFEHDRPFDREYAGLQRYEPVSRSHEGLVNILHVGRHEDGRCFYCVMELADDASGAADIQAYRPKTLRSELTRRGRLPPEECVTLAFSLASALGHLHQRGLVHRDLKPSNIIFVHDQPKIADIGLVTESGDSRSFVGTEGFFPPQGPGTPQADLYALGKVLYEAGTGLDRLRFPQMPPEWLQAPERETLLEFNEVLVKACETDPARRYQSAEEMLADLALLRVGKSVRRLHGLERRLRLARRLGGAALGLALLAAGAYGLAQRQARLERESRQRTERAESEARRQLAEARLAQARALRRTGLAGQRFDCLDVIAAAARAQPSLELRNEALGALALADLRLVRRLPEASPSRPGPAIDPQHQRYACGDAEGVLSIRRVADDAEVCRLPGAGRPLNWLFGFSPDGRYLAVRPTRNQLTVWDLDRRAKILEVPQQQNEVWAQFRMDSRSLVWSAGAQPLRQVDFGTGQIASRWPVNQTVWRFSGSPDHHYLALAYAQTNQVDVLNLENGQIAARLPQAGFVTEIQWHPRLSLLATACGDLSLHIWDPVAGTELLVLTGHQSVTHSFAFHPTAPVLASVSWDGTTRLWDWRTGQELVVLPDAGNHLEFSADGRWLTFHEYSTEARLLVCEVAVDTVCRTLQAPRPRGQAEFREVAFDPSGRWLAGAYGSGVHLFDAGLGTSVDVLSVGPVFSVWFEPDEQHLVGAGEAGLMRWPVETPPDGVLKVGKATPLGPASQTTSQACRSGNRLAWTHNDHIHVWQEGLQVARLSAPSDLQFVAMSADGRWLAGSAARSYSAHLWETETWQQTRVIPVPGAAQLAFSPDNVFLVIGTPDEFIFWDLAAAVPRHRLPRHHTATAFGALAFSTDGTLLAALRTRTLIVLYAYPSLRELAAFEAPRAAGGGVTSLAFDPAGTRLATAGSLNQVQVWDLRTMRQRLAKLGLDW